MKGIVFTEFINMVEEMWDLDMADDLIDASNLESGGAYTSVGTYDHTELVQLVQALSEKTDLPAEKLIFTFGQHLAATFSSKFPIFFSEVENTFDLLKRVDQHIHVEVRKLYPDAELPRFYFEEPDPKTLILHYESTRGFADLAHGLIDGAAAHYREQLDVSRETKNKDELWHEIFTLRTV